MLRLFSTARHSSAAEAEAINLSVGISADQAVEYGLARQTARNFEDLKTIYRIEGEIRKSDPNWALTLIEKLADRRIALFFFLRIDHGERPVQLLHF